MDNESGNPMKTTSRESIFFIGFIVVTIIVVGLLGTGLLMAFGAVSMFYGGPK